MTKLNSAANSSPMPPGRVLIDVRTVAAKYGCDERSVFRWADCGKIPFGIKLSSLRRWDVAEIDAHIANGCKPVRVARRAARRQKGGAIMSNNQPQQFRDANEYAEHVKHCRRPDVDVIPAAPNTPGEWAVIRFEYRCLAVEYLPLLLSDTQCRRALIEFLADVAD